MIRVAARELCWQARILSSFPRCRGSESKEHGPPVFDEFMKRVSKRTRRTCSGSPTSRSIRQVGPRCIAP